MVWGVLIALLSKTKCTFTLETTITEKQFTQGSSTPLPPMLESRKDKLEGVCVLGSNVVSSVILVFVNKKLMDSSGYAFSFGKCSETL